MEAKPNASRPAVGRLRRWFQFRLTTLLACTAVVAAIVGVVVAPIYRARRGRAIIAGLESVGAHLQFDYQFDSQGNWNEDAPPPRTAGWQGWLGEDESRRIVRIGLYHSPHGVFPTGMHAPNSFPPDVNQAIERIKPQLEAIDHPFGLSFNFSSLNADGLAQLVGLRRLELLDLGETALSDDDLSVLAQMTSLRDLTLPAIAGDDALAHVAALRHLRRLARGRPEPPGDLSLPDADDFERVREGQWLTNEGLARLKGHAELEELDLNFARVTDEGLTSLAELTKLRTLDLSHTDVTDAGLALLKPLRRLETLDLSETRVLGDGLAALAELPALRSLDLAACRPSLDMEDVRNRRGKAAYDAEQRAAASNAVTWLGDLKQLESLYLNGVDFQAESLACLAELPRLKLLDLSGCSITNSGLEYLLPASQLQELWLASTPLDNGAVKTLKRFRRLKLVHVGGTEIKAARFEGSRIEASDDFTSEHLRQW